MRLLLRSWFVAAVVFASVSARAADLSKIPELDLSTATKVVRPEYPYEARRLSATGSGIAVMEIDTSRGKVQRVYMGQSTGARVLDDAAVIALRHWRFKPGGPPVVKTPITFGMSSGGGGGVEVVKSKRSMDDVLAGFLGKGTVINGPIPDYPRSVTWTNKSGKGVYELHAGKDGRVHRVRIVKSSGDALFDEQAVKTLGKWRLRRGPVVVELPLSFTLTPTNYAVDVAR